MSNQGTFNPFEKEVREAFFNHTLLGDPDDAVEFVREQRGRFLAGMIPEEQLAYEKKAGKDHTEYSIRSKQRFVQEIRKQRAMKGESVRWWLTPNELESKMFGNEGSISTPLTWLTGFSADWL